MQSYLVGRRRRFAVTSRTWVIVLVGPLLAAPAGAADTVAPATEAPATAPALHATAVNSSIKVSALPAPRPIENLGVELVSVALSASGFMIDVRYRVLDAAKAQALAERKVSPTLINDVTGHRYYVPNTPKIGPLRQSATAKQPLLAGRVYFMLFANPDHRLRQGEKVSLHVGDAVIDDIVVR